MVLPIHLSTLNNLMFMVYFPLVADKVQPTSNLADREEPNDFCSSDSNKSNLLRARIPNTSQNALR